MDLKELASPGLGWCHSDAHHSAPSGRYAGPADHTAHRHKCFKPAN